MTYTKIRANSDKITIDGTDVSNSFNVFSATSEHSEIDVSGFSAAGTDETIPGSTAQSFTGTAFYTEELGTILQPLHANRTPCVVTWQPNGLVDATREIYSGTCIIFQWNPEDTRGGVGTVPFLARPSTSAGITVGNWT